MKILALGVFVLSVSASAARAEVGISGDLGTTGIGVHVTLPVLSSLNARLGFNAFNYAFSSSTSDVSYQLKLKLQTFDVLGDYYPISGSGFRLTGGLIYDGNKIDATGKPNQTGTYTINGNTYSSSTVGTLNGNISFRKLAPYAGLGWGNALNKDSNWSFATDLGVMYQGAASSSLSNANCTASAATCSQLATDIAAENQTLNDKVSKYKVFPVLRVGVGYTF